MQRGLFEPPEALTIVDDATGRIVYFPMSVPHEQATAWFESLRRQISWTSERRMMYDREVDVPRLVARLSPDSPAFPAAATEALEIAQRVAQHDFNSIGLNYYRDGQDSVAPHNDKIGGLVEGAPILVLSLGATRRMTIRAKQQPRRAVNIDLANGSALMMSYVTQFHYDHGIPKTRESVGPRISLAFRERKRGPTGDDLEG